MVFGHFYMIVISLCAGPMAVADFVHNKSCCSANNSSFA